MKPPVWPTADDLHLMDLFTSGASATAIGRLMRRSVSAIKNRTSVLRHTGYFDCVLSSLELSIILGRERSGSSVGRMLKFGLFGKCIVIGNGWAYGLTKIDFAVWCGSTASFGLDLDRVPQSKWRTMMVEARHGYEILKPKEYARRIGYGVNVVYEQIRNGYLATTPHIGGRGREYRIVIRKRTA